MSSIFKNGSNMFKSSFTGSGDEFAKPSSKSSDMRKIFLESYGVEMNFPGYYYFDSKFVPLE